MGAGLPSSLRWIDRSSVLLVLLTTLLLLLPTTTLAQDVRLIPSAGTDTFPACAVSCQVLTQAQDACVPPSAPVSNQQTYVSCFCQSTLLSNLKNNAAGVCGTSCSNQAELVQLQKWYADYCASGGKTGAATTTNAAPTPSRVTYPAPPPWITTHYRWVIMIVILVVGFTALTVLGVWLKRRYDAKRPGLYHGEDTSRGGGPGKLGRQHTSNSVVDTAIWGPPQAMAHTRGFDGVEPAAAQRQPEMSSTGSNSPMVVDPVAHRGMADASQNSMRESTRLQKPGAQTREGDVEIREV